MFSLNFIMRENFIKFPSSRHILIPRLMTFDILVKIQELKRIFPNWSTFLLILLMLTAQLCLNLFAWIREYKNQIQKDYLRAI